VSYSIPNGGPIAMVWGVSCVLSQYQLELFLRVIQWAVASIFILVVGLSMAELASAAPTSGGVCHVLHSAPLHHLSS
jgi:amino acid transporter